MTRLVRGIIWLLPCLLTLTGSSLASADELRPGYLAFTQKNAHHWSLVWKVPVTGGLRPHIAPLLPKGCRTEGEPKREMREAALVSTYPVRCQGSVAGGRIGLSDLTVTRNDVLVRVAPLGRPVQAMRLTAASPTATIAAKSGFWEVARTYFVTGVEHILFGYDHLLFVVALVLLLQRAWIVTKAVTAFTIAHSLTLVGTTLGFLGLPQEPVEALIALSIVFLAVEIVKREPDRAGLAERAPWIVAFIFGLLHGFGFAGALREIGLPESDVPAALVSFNLGVEAGQIVIVLICVAILWCLRRVSTRVVTPAVRFASYAIGMTSSYWLIDRLM